MSKVNRYSVTKKEKQDDSNPFDFRGSLKNLIKRYYKILGFEITEKSGLLEIAEKGSKYSTFKFVFNRKDAQKYPEAELISFNSPRLNKIIQSIIEKGKIAKAFIPFEYEPEQTFKQALANLQKKQEPNDSFIRNGTIKMLEHYIGYVPFLVFILRINIVSLESFTVIERPVIPLLDPEKEIKLDVNYYAKKLENYFEVESPDLSTRMPVKGELLEIGEEKFKAHLDYTIDEINISVEKQKEQIKGRLEERKRKELDIIENYYDQRIDELYRRIELARERSDKEDVKKYQQRVEHFEEERKFKTSECQDIYQMETSYEVIGAALIYAPALFYYKCKISTPFGDIERNFQYDIFDHQIIPPICDCGKPIYSGIICENLHLTCLECSYRCEECEKLICARCDMNFCSRCRVPLCSDHSYECEHCKEMGKSNIWICERHRHICAECGKTLCPNCVTECVVCDKDLCKHDEECSIECDICGKHACKEHTFECDYDNKIYCTNERTTCHLCDGTYCIRHMTRKNVCKTCSEATENNFYKFLRYKKARLNLAEIVEIPSDDPIEEVYIGRKKFKVPRSQLAVRMNDNKTFYIFIITRPFEKIVIVYDKNLNEETVYIQPNILGKLRNLFRKEVVKKFEPIDPVVLIEGITRTSRKIDTEKPRCQNCNKTFKKGYKICPYCGQELINS